jgi:short-subunit dehydrogenase
MTSLLSKYGAWAIVTGASSGIGEGFARVLASHGFSLILVARRGDRLEKLAPNLLQLGAGAAEIAVLDLARSDFLDELIQKCDGREIGLVVSNAGDGAKGSFEELPREKKLALIDINCRAPLLLADAFLPRLRAQGRGGFIITSSIESVVGFPYSASYAATKAFASSLGQGLWGELRGTGVDVLVLEPGATDTELLPRSGMKPEDMAGLMQPEEVARQALEKLGHGPVVVAGVMNRVLVGLLSLLPKGLAVRMVGFGMRSAIEKGSGSE